MTMTPARAAWIFGGRKPGQHGDQAKEALNFVMILFKKMGEKTVRTVLASTQKTAEEFRMALMRTAQPELSALSQKRIEMLRALRVPARTSIYGDPAFESDLLKITHTPRKLADFEVERLLQQTPVRRPEGGEFEDEVLKRHA